MQPTPNHITQQASVQEAIQQQASLVARMEAITMWIDHRSMEDI